VQVEGSSANLSLLYAPRARLLFLTSYSLVAVLPCCSWKEQKEAMLNKIKDTTQADNDEITRNLLGLAKTRPDIFGECGTAAAAAAAATVWFAWLAVHGADVTARHLWW
jgi:hypothetical protein